MATARRPTRRRSGVQVVPEWIDRLKIESDGDLAEFTARFINTIYRKKAITLFYKQLGAAIGQCRYKDLIVSEIREHFCGGPPSSDVSQVNIPASFDPTHYVGRNSVKLVMAIFANVARFPAAAQRDFYAGLWNALGDGPPYARNEIKNLFCPARVALGVGRSTKKRRRKRGRKSRKSRKRTCRSKRGGSPETAAAKQQERALEAQKRHHERMIAAKDTERREAQRQALDAGEAGRETVGKTLVQMRIADEGETELPGGDQVGLWGRETHDQLRVDKWRYGEMRNRQDKIKEDLGESTNSSLEYREALRRELSELEPMVEDMRRKLGIRADGPGQRGLLAQTMSFGKRAVVAVKRGVTPRTRSKIYMDTQLGSE